MQKEVQLLHVRSRYAVLQRVWFAGTCYGQKPEFLYKVACVSPPTKPKVKQALQLQTAYYISITTLICCHNEVVSMIRNDTYSLQVP